MAGVVRNSIIMHKSNQVRLCWVGVVTICHSVTIIRFVQKQSFNLSVAQNNQAKKNSDTKKLANRNLLEPGAELFHNCNQ